MGLDGQAAARRFAGRTDRGGRTRASAWARLALAIGGLLLSAAVALIVWDAAAGDPAPAVITGVAE